MWNDLTPLKPILVVDLKAIVPGLMMLCASFVTLTKEEGTKLGVAEREWTFFVLQNASSFLELFASSKRDVDLCNII